MITCYLTDNEIEKVAKFARSIFEFKRKRKVLNSALVKNWDLLTCGYLAEFAFCRRYGVKFNWKIQMRGDGGVDTIVHGKTVDIKCTRQSEGHLILFPNTNIADALIYSEVQPETKGVIRFLGCISGSRFEKEAIERDFGYGKRLCVPFRKLSSFDIFDEWAQTSRQAVIC